MSVVKIEPANIRAESRLRAAILAATAFEKDAALIAGADLGAGGDRERKLKLKPG